MVSSGLTLAHSKAEVVVLTKKMISTLMPVRFGDEVVESKPEVKYFGMMFVAKLNFFSRLGVRWTKRRRE